MKRLEISLHGLSNEHFKILTELKSLEKLRVDSGSCLMIDGDKPQQDRWTPIKVDDEGAKWISKIPKLEMLWFRSPETRDGKVSFTEKGIEYLLKAPALEAIAIDSGSFTENGLKAVKSVKLPSHVYIFDR